MNVNKKFKVEVKFVSKTKLCSIHPSKCEYLLNQSQNFEPIWIPSEDFFKFRKLDVTFVQDNLPCFFVNFSCLKFQYTVWKMFYPIYIFERQYKCPVKNKTSRYKLLRILDLEVKITRVG